MDSSVLLAKMQAHLERAPSHDVVINGSKESLTWLAQGHAMLSQIKFSIEAIQYKSNWDSLNSQIFGPDNYEKLKSGLYRQIASLELEVGSDDTVSFAPGEVYKYFQQLNQIINSAEKNIFIVDPYLDASIFSHYLNSRNPEVTVRLLTGKRSKAVKPAAEKYIEEFGPVVEVKKSNQIHDRVIFIDGYSGWISGQSIKDAAKDKPTYLVAVSPDVIPDKLRAYESIWQSATKFE